MNSEAAILIQPPAAPRPGLSPTRHEGVHGAGNASSNLRALCCESAGFLSGCLPLGAERRGVRVRTAVSGSRLPTSPGAQDLFNSDHCHGHVSRGRDVSKL